MTTSRRDFIKMCGAALAAAFVPKPKDVEIAIENDDLYANFEPPLEKCPKCGGDKWECLGDDGFVRCASCLEPHALNNRTELLKEFVWTSGSIESGATVYVSQDNGDTWDRVGTIA